MKKIVTTINSSLPSVNKAYNPFDIIGNTVGRYFDYKRETAMIEYETQKIKVQAEIIGKQIDTQLQKSLDVNKKNFKKEMKRLKTIAKDLKNGVKVKAKLLKQINTYIKMLSDNSLPIEIKETIPDLISEANRLLAQESNHSIQKLNIMSNFNNKLIEGE